MAKLTTNNITGGYASTSELNDNFDLIETAVENTLSRDGTTPNSMAADLDMDSNDINNAATVSTNVLKINGTSVVPTGTITAAASAITNTPAGDIAATDVQTAINELDTEKVAETDFSAFGKTLVDDATAAAARTTLSAAVSGANSDITSITGLTTDLAITHGGTGQSTAQAAIDALTQVSAATNEYVLTKDTATGNAVYKVVTLGDGIVTQAKIDTSSLTPIVQEVITTSGTAASYTTPTLIPLDNTTPQNTEGAALSFDTIITPTSATNKLIIEASVHTAFGGGAEEGQLCLFQDATAGALAVTWQRHTAASVVHQHTLKYEMVAGTTSATTFKLRFGGNAGNTFHLNSIAGTNVFNGLLVSSLKITEVLQ